MNYIKIPKDFKNLHDLGDLVNNYELMSKLQNALNNYQDTYFKSFIKSYDEVLDYIPKSNYNKYKIRFKNKYLFNYKSYWGNKIENDGKIEQNWADISVKLNKKYNYWANRYNEHISYFKINDSNSLNINDIKNGLFIVNDIKKEIILLDIINNPNIETKLLPANDSLIYKNNNYTVDVENNKLNVQLDFEHKTSYPMGGVWINGRKNGYLSGDYTYIPYTRYGYYKYIFDTNKNEFIDYNYYIDPKKEWQPINSRY